MSIQLTAQVNFRISYRMNKLVELAENINSYNLKGSSRLAPLRLALLYRKRHLPLVEQLTREMQGEKVHAALELMGLSGYQILRSGNVHGLELHLLGSLEDEEAISDDSFLRRKKVIERLRCHRETVFLCLEQEDALEAISHERAEVLELKRVDRSVCKNIAWKGSLPVFYAQLVRTWESIHRFEIIGVLANLKQLMKNLERNRSKEREWLAVKEGRGDELAHAFRLVNLSNDYLVCSLEGYYSREAANFQNQFSVHWQIMDIFEDLWKEQGEKISRELERMPLSYIGETLRMSNCHSLGGFLPESCFLQVFKPILEQLAEHVIRCLEGAKFKVLQCIQSIYEFYFEKTSIKEQLVELELRNVEAIIENFLAEVEGAIHSQIDYVYAPSESFWEMRNVHSNLYSEEQQANIEVKYIGKVYVKRVYDSLRESVPRYIGQGLLRKVSKYFRDNGLNNLLEITKETEFSIVLSRKEMQEIRQKEVKLKEYDRLFQYFSLKVSSAHKIKNLHEKSEARWKQTYQRRAQEEREPLKEEEGGEKGLVGWIKRLFKSDKQRQNRSQSCQKSQIKEESIIQAQVGSVDAVKKEKQPESAISEKLWILILNTNKKIDEERLIMASCEGFPERLRPAIWHWFSRRLSEEKEPKIQEILSRGKPDEETVRQIEKDLNRTPPPELFRARLKGSLRKVLTAYSMVDQEIKYTQGMNFIAAVALATLSHWQIKDDYLIESSEKQQTGELEEKSFSILKFIMLKQGFRRVMFIEREYIAELCFRIDEQIKQLNERVWTLIQDSGFSCEIIFGPILLAGLSTWSKKMEVCKRIMDLFICRGFSVMYRVVAGVAAMSEEQLARLRSEQIYDYLRNKSLDEFYERAGGEGLTKLFQSI